MNELYLDFLAQQFLNTGAGKSNSQSIPLFQTEYHSYSAMRHFNRDNYGKSTSTISLIDSIRFDLY